MFRQRLNNRWIIYIDRFGGKCIDGYWLIDIIFVSHKKYELYLHNAYYA